MIMRNFLLVCLLLFFAGLIQAETTLSPTVIDAGGGMSSLGATSAFLTIGGVVGGVSSENYRASWGFASQLRPLSTSQLTMTCSPPEGGQTVPSAGVHTLYVGDSYTLKAYPNEGFSFTKWTGDDQVIIDSPTSTSTSFAIRGPATISAEFSSVSTLYTSLGAVTKVNAISGGLQQFTKIPKVYTAQDGGSQIALSVVTPVSTKTPAPSVLAEWKKIMLIYNKSDYVGEQLGKTLVDTPMSNFRLGNLNVSSKEFKNSPVKLEEVLYLAAPVTTDVPQTPVNPGDLFTVQGKYFGKTAPKVLIEYRDPSGKWKYKACKINKLTTYLYEDAKGKPQKSCQKILEDDTVDDKPVGYSTVTAQYPTLPKDSLPSSYVVIDNSFGMAAFKFHDVTSR